jgi:hypothetical protein
MTPKQALEFVKSHGFVLESARGPVPSLAETIAGQRINGSWWKHPKANAIFRCSRAIRDSPDVLVCRIVSGKVTYVHRRLWPALVRLADRFEPDQLASIREIHTASGKHKIEITAFPKWAPPDVISAGAKLTADQAAALIPIRLKRV